MSKWEIVVSKESQKFLRKNNLPDSVVTRAIASAIKKFSGEEINIDLKKLRPPYDGYFRVRVGKIRIIFSIDFDLRSVDVAEINWRGSSYQA